MKQFKQKTLVLVLASVITVAGASRAADFKNNLMSLEFDNPSNNAVDVILHTKKEYADSIVPKKTDEHTYVIMLPETDGSSAKRPELTQNIENVDIRTMPYTQNGKGYTKITIKTSSNTTLNAKKALYTKEEFELLQTAQDETNFDMRQEEDNIMYERNRAERNLQNARNNQQPERVNRPQNNNVNKAAEQTNYNTVQKDSSNAYKPEESSNNNIIADKQNVNKEEPSKDNSGTIIFVLASLLVVMACVYFYIKGSNKMAEIIGEQADFSIDDEKNEKENKKSKRKKIKNTINTLDKMYRKPQRMPIDISNENIGMNYNNSIPLQNIENNEINDDSSNIIVDLDELFQEQNNNINNEETEEENTSLDDFLSEFNITDTHEEEIIAEKESNDLINEMFDKYIKNGNAIFSASDIEKINKLLNMEISDYTMEHLSEFVVSNPIKSNKPSSREVLENLITTYTLTQNISFTKTDVDALNKLINVEIGQDFINDLTTNPQRTKEMAKEIEARKVIHKKNEILTLNVKDLLPDLSEALKKQGGKRIESEVKPEVVYYSEGYDVDKLQVSNDLPDLVLDLDNPEYTKYRPSDEIVYSDDGYEVNTLEIDNEILPDLKDAIANPNKYNTPKEKPSVDENKLLNNITNVQFKPFYDGYENFEISKNFDEPVNVEKEDSQVELSESSVMVKTETQEQDVIEKSNDMQHEELPILEHHHRKYTRIASADENAAKLLELIENQQKQRREKIKQKAEEAKIKENNNIKQPQVIHPDSCIIDNQKYEIISASEIENSVGCYLAKNEDGYSILGYIKDKIFKIKYYKNIQASSIQSRINEKLNNGETQYIVRLGIHKFLMNVSGDKMECVMDLC